jgi:hypothetical protein
MISAMPFLLKRMFADIIALFVYLPMAKCALLLEKLGANVDLIPLSTYRRHSFYTMRTDSLDRFGTRLEQRFSRQTITSMMHTAGLESIEFSEDEPYWCAIGFKRKV